MDRSLKTSFFCPTEKPILTETEQRKHRVCCLDRRRLPLSYLAISWRVGSRNSIHAPNEDGLSFPPEIFTLEVQGDANQSYHNWNLN
jgi:hypothetical protein